MSRMVSFSLLCAVLLAGEASAAKKTPVPSPVGADDTAVDISDVKDKLVILHDGHQHYLAVVPFGDTFSHLYYGNGKAFHAQRVSSGGRSGNTQWNRVFWDPRVAAGAQRSVDFNGGKYSVQCGTRTTELVPVTTDEQAAMLKDARFAKPLWTHEAYSLTRDNKGTYYYVDRLREPEGNKSFRLFSGPRGNMKPLKMTNVISDSQGDIFSTKKGELRLVLDRKRPVWAAGKAETDLVSLPIEDNHILIYSDLGVYSGQRLGTPCDDLL